MAPSTFSSGDDAGTLIGERVLFTGRTPMTILASSLMPALYLMSEAYCRQSPSALALAMSLAATETLVRCVGSMAVA